METYFWSHKITLLSALSAISHDKAKFLESPLDSTTAQLTTLSIWYSVTGVSNQTIKLIVMSTHTRIRSIFYQIHEFVVDNRCLMSLGSSNLDWGIIFWSSFLSLLLSLAWHFCRNMRPLLTVAKVRVDEVFATQHNCLHTGNRALCTQ